MGRKFRHKDGFGDDTDYLEVIEDGTCIIHYNDGSTQIATVYNLSDCLNYVKAGKWIELTKTK